MANNCLVTKLKAVVNNDNLPLLGKVIFKVGPYPSGTSQADINSENNYGRRIELKSITPNIKIGEVLDNNKTKIQDLTTDAYGSVAYLYPSDASSEVFLTVDKYKTKAVLNNSHGKLIELYDYNINDILDMPELIEIGLHGSNCSGSLSEFLLKLQKSADIETCLLSYCDMYGDVSDFAPYLKLSKAMLRYTGINGNVEDLVVGQIQAGRNYIDYPTIKFVESNNCMFHNTGLVGTCTITFGSNNTATVSGLDIYDNVVSGTYDGTDWHYNG